MAKLDEIAELLTEEIRGFENSVGRLEKLQRELKTFRIEPDTSGIDLILKRYNDHQIKSIEEQHKLMGDVIHYIKKSITIPKWTVKLFWGLSATTLLVLGYAWFQVSQIPKKEQAAYERGESKAVSHFKAFLEQTPEADILYEKWGEPQSKK